MSKAIVGRDKFTQALFDGGVIQNSPDEVCRIVIDLEAGSIAKVYVELFADDDKLCVALNGGIELFTA